MLGIADVIVLDYPDGMPALGRCGARSRRDIRDAIATRRPDVVITFDEDGLYWHPDHIAMHERPRAAVARLGGRRRRCTTSRCRTARCARVLERRRPTAAPATRRRSPRHRRAGCVRRCRRTPPTLVVDAAAFAAAQAGRAACHRSQVAGDALRSPRPTDEAAALAGRRALPPRRRRLDARRAFIERLARLDRLDEHRDARSRCSTCCGARSAARRSTSWTTRRVVREGDGDRCGRDRVPVLRVPDRRRHPGAHRRRRPAAPRCTRSKPDAATRRAVLAARSRRRAGAATRFARCCDAAARDLSRGDRGPQPRRRGHVFRLPLLRSDVRHGRGAAARARRRSRRRARPRARSLRRIGAPDPRARAAAAAEPRGARRRVLLEAVAGAALHGAGRASRSAATPTTRCRSPAARSRWSCCRMRFRTSGTSACWPAEMMRLAGDRRHHRDAAPAQLARLELLGRHDADAGGLPGSVRAAGTRGSSATAICSTTCSAIRAIDLSRDVTPGRLGDEPSITLVASRDADLFRAPRPAESRRRSPASCG